MNGGSLQVSVGVKATGRDPPPGNTPDNGIPDLTRTVSGGATQALAYGMGDGKADSVCAAEFTIAPSASLTLDLYTGDTGDDDLPNVFGKAAPFRVLRSLVVVVMPGTGDGSGVRCGGAASNEFQGWFANAGDQQDIGPGGTPFVQGTPEGRAVTATAKNFKIENLSPDVFVRVRVYAGGGKLVPGMAVGFLGGVYS